MPEFQSRFWDDFNIPWQDKDLTNYQFANPVRVQQDFLRIVTEISVEGSRKEKLMREIAQHDQKRAELERKHTRLMHSILVGCVGTLAKTANEAVRSAHIKANATLEERVELQALEDGIDTEEAALRRLRADLEIRSFRIRCLETKGNMAREYLNYEKLEMRVGMDGGLGR